MTNPERMSRILSEASVEDLERMRDVLERSVGELRTHGWARGTLYDDLTGNVCIAGAIRLAAGYAIVGRGLALPTCCLPPICDRLTSYLGSFLGDNYGSGQPIGLVDFNDHYAASVDDVLDIVRQGIKAIVAELESR